jgi:hypothetical protein
MDGAVEMIGVGEGLMGQEVTLQITTLSRLSPIPVVFLRDPAICGLALRILLSRGYLPDLSVCGVAVPQDLAHGERLTAGNFIVR